MSAAGARAPYRPQGYDEAIDAEARPRPEYRSLLEALADRSPAELGERVAAAVRKRRIVFENEAAGTYLHVDPVPRLIGADEWRLLAAGLRQRALALNAFVVDIYGDAAIVAKGRIPPRVVESAEYFEPSLRETAVVGELPAPVIGFDLVRGADGNLAVLEDNVRTPSGISYTDAIREAVDEALAGVTVSPTRLDPGEWVAAMSEELANGPAGATALVSDGPQNNAWYEHSRLGERLGLPVVTPDQLELRRGRLLAHADGGELEIGTVYRRTDEDRLFNADGKPTWIERLLGEPARAGTVRVLSALGSGVVDDKLVHAYVEEMIGFYLGEAPLLASVRSYDLAEPEVREQALARLDQLVVKPRARLGGEGVVICADADRAERDRVAAEIRRDPERFIAQETVALSTHPTVAGDGLEPRHIDLRAYAVGCELMPSLLTRVALARGDRIVNSSQNGGDKDTWVEAAGLAASPSGE